MSAPEACDNLCSVPPPEDFVRAHTLAWVRAVVVGLNLCPFAAPVVQAERLHIAVSPATSVEALAADLSGQLTTLAQADPAVIETMLLVHPGVLVDFLDYNDFLDLADALIDSLGLVGQIQIASFHPQYCFADTAPDDPDNLGNRSPWPMLHLLREQSIERAVLAFGDTDRIVQANVRRLRELGHAGLAIVWPPLP